MLENWSATALPVHLAALTYVIGFLTRDQLVLRGLILIGTVFYIAYYYLEPETPLWDAIGWSVVMGLANGYTMLRIYADRRPAHFEEEDLVIYGAIRQIAPGDFRRLMAGAEKKTVAEDLVITDAGIVPGHLYFIVEGDLAIDKESRFITAGGPTFIGEIAYLLNQPASATVTLKAGGRFARWKVTVLRGLVAKHENLGTALEIAFNRDLAAKVAAS